MRNGACSTNWLACGVVDVANDGEEGGEATGSKEGRKKGCGKGEAVDEGELKAGQVVAL